MKGALRAAASAGLVALALYLLDWHALESALRSIDGGTFALAVALTIVVFLLLGVRWYLLVAPGAALPFLVQMRHYLVGTFVNFFTPANIGGDIYRVLALRDATGGSMPVVAAVVRERFLGLAVYLFAYVVLLGLAWREFSAVAHFWTSLPFLLLVACIAALALLAGPAQAVLAVFARRPWVAARARWLQAAEFLRFSMIFRNWGEFARLVALSAAGTALWVAVVALVSSRLGVGLGWAAIGAVAIAAELIRMIPVTLQGIGLREGAFAYLFQLLGQSAEAGFTVGLISYLALSCALLATGLLALALPREAD
jgi:glycosyltransferase 2 family protein